MRNVTCTVILVLSIALAIVGCSRQPIGSTAAPAAEQADMQIALVCPAGQRQCMDCNGNLFCATRCTFPLCPAPVAPEPEETDESSTVAGLTAVGEACGGVICSPGLRCCNPSCNICTAKGVECTQQSCN